MKRITQTLTGGRVLISDGAWGTFLIRKGLRPGECPELWNVEHREAVLEIARSYVEAGSDAISTNSFGGSAFKLAHYGLSDRVHELNRAAAAISREAAGPNRFVMGSIGPTGKILMMGDVTEEELYEAFKGQSLALADGGADACLIETMTALDEATIAIRAAKENTPLEVICTFTYDRQMGGRYHTMMGVAPASMAEAALAAGADIIGVNCSLGPGEMPPIVRELRQAAPNTPILVQPNAGHPVVKNGLDTYSETPETFARFVPELMASGAGFLGACCGSGPDHIRAIAAATAGRRA
ncbi:MAG: homocysteine S-methyltransferase family protein [Candidatus Hydrogenedentes bacterium]|nr:homocysteine S-methyltransferase family protein [Candidatus Hydrogenedentota bacterium]